MGEVVAIGHYRTACEDLDSLRGVEADLTEMDERVEGPLIEVAVGPGYRRIPPRVHRVIAAHDLGTRNSMRQRTDRGALWIVEVL